MLFPLPEAIDPIIHHCMPLLTTGTRFVIYPDAEATPDFELSGYARRRLF